MEVVNSSNIYAVIVAIEEYRFGINKVKYALNDANAFYNLLINDFNIPAENIDLWLGKDANKTALEQELPYKIRQANSDDLLIFYYAGHGFCERGYNRVTTWDTHPQNLADTTVIIKDVLLEPLQNSAVKKSLIFIDACATNLLEQGISRDMLSQMNNSEFENFIRSGDYQATFLSCSPNEKSYSSDILRHGIWTWHLLKALKGEVPHAIVRDRYITSTSLQDYLRSAIPDYIQRNTEIRGSQTPRSLISSSNTFEIRELALDESQWVAPLNDIKLNIEDMFFRNMETSDITRLPGFSKSKGHFVPDRHSDYVTSFIQTRLSDRLSEELETIYERSKDILSLRRKQIQKNFDGGGGTIDTPFYRYYLEALQNPDDYRESLIIRKMVLLVNRSELPESFEYIFPTMLNEIVIPISGQIDFDTMVERFEELVENIGGNLTEDDNSGIIIYSSTENTKVIVMEYAGELVIKPRQSTDLTHMLEQAKSSLVSISSASAQKAIEE
jgi:hypothetical protein